MTGQAPDRPPSRPPDAFEVEARRRWIDASDRLGLDHGMPNFAAALAAQEQPIESHDRDDQAAQEPGRAEYEAWRAAIPDWVCNVPGGPWDELPPAVRAGFAAIAARGQQPAPGPACRTCDGSGTLLVPDPGHESASEQACTDPVHDTPADRESRLRGRHRALLDRFTRASDGYRARLSGTVLMREYRDAGLDVPDGLKHLERHEAELRARGEVAR